MNGPLVALVLVPPSSIVLHAAVGRPSSTDRTDAEVRRLVMGTPYEVQGK